MYDVKRSVDELVKELSNLLPKLFGRKLSPRASALLPQELYGKAEELLLLQKKAEGMRFKDLTKVEAIWLLEQIDKGVHLLIDDVPAEQRGLDWLLERLHALIAPIAGISYLSETSYQEYRDSLFDLAHTICKYSLEQGDQLTDFLNDVDQDLDASVAMGQMFMTRLMKDYRFLDGELGRSTSATMRRYTRIYGDLSGYFEKSIRVIVGLLDILDGMKPDYRKIKRTTLAANVGRVRKSAYAILSGMIDTTIRNAIAHKSDYFDPVKKTVEFPNLTQARSFSCQEFLCQTRELSALVLALTQFRLILSFDQLSLFKLILEKLETEP
ncbi:MAG: hypothetical protein IMY79_02970 [Chloroflexi bacterium]|nr:hypothetical protein [Chloroflexota bacterium]